MRERAYLALNPLLHQTVDHEQRVFLNMGAPTWPNGFDIAPDWLWREMEAAGKLGRVAAK